MAQGSNKLVGTQYLDLTRLRNDVAETNKLLQSIGTGVNLNMTDVVEKQLRQMLARFKAEIQNASSNAAKSGNQIANGLSPAVTQIEHLLTTTQRLGKDGALTETRKGYDALGRSITEVYRNGLLMNKSLVSESSLNKGIQEANRLYQEQVGYLKKVYQLKLQAMKVEPGSHTDQNIRVQIANTEQQIDANNRLIAQLDKEAVARSKLSNLSADEARISAKYVDAQVAEQDRLHAATQKSLDDIAGGVQEIQQLQKAYKQLTNAYRQHIAAIKNGNVAGQQYWAQSAEAAQEEIRSIDEKITFRGKEEAAQKKILDLLHQAENAEHTHAKAVEKLNSGASELDQTLDRMGSRLIQMATTMLVLRGLTALWRNATEYAQTYNDLLNEIRIVTGKSQAEANRLGQSYRVLAKNMKVSSIEIATAATEFWRQGQSESEVNQRLIASTQYAKISAMEFDESAELITAATNTMNVGAQRVVDVFAYLGDASASGADEIGVAMQRASASAVEFKLSFEWLGAYIATISEQTRQAPEVIGTSINSIMARLHSIKAKGFSEEDATQINDVAKALANIDVALMDTSGDWRAMSDIFSDIAGKWDDLDSKTKGYIATTMAGTRQQNYFLALMNDMSKGIEGGSRAYELYAGAMNAAGTAAQKYAIWQESVTAAQNRLTAALESFYSLLNADWMKTFYNSMAGLVEIITAGTDTLGGWNLMIPLVAAGITGLIAIVFKAITAFKTLKAAMVAGAGVTTLLSGGAIGGIIAAVAALTAVVTMITGAVSMANDVEKMDYSSTISSVTNYRDSIDKLVTELEALAGKTELSAAEQARAEEIMRTLSGTSLTMKDALENGGKGFDSLAEKAAAARGEVLKTEEAIRALNAADALQNLRDADRAYADTIAEAQSRLISVAQYGDIAEAYASYMRENPSGKYTQGYASSRGGGVTKEENFYTYAQNQSKQGTPFWYLTEDRDKIQANRDFWAGVVKEMEALGIDYSTSVEEIGNKMLEFNISAGSYAEANRQKLDEAWQPVLDSLHTVMTDGTEFSQLPSFMQDAAAQYYESYVGAIDKQAALAEGDLMAMAADLTGYVDNMAKYVEDNSDFSDLIGRFDELLEAPRSQETVDELNDLLPLINEYIVAYNELTASTDDDIPLIPAFTLDSLQDVQEGVEAASAALASMSTADIYKDLELARVEANGFITVLSRLGDGEGQFVNLHDAVMDTAQAVAEATGIVDEKEIVQIGEKLLEGLYETYPEISDYVDVATGLLLDGWKDGIADATNPWTALFDSARLEDALNKARQDMAALDGSALWSELLSPAGKGLYQHAEDWAKTLIPDGTAEEIHSLAESYVDVFFTMFEDIDTEIMGADGRIAAGMDSIIATMRKAAHDTNIETSKIASAYKNLHADTIARNEAISGLQTMSGLASGGDAAGVNSAFEALSAEAINAITAAMPELIDKLHDGTASAADFEAAILKLHESEHQAGRDAWKDYFDSTEAGLKEQSALWGQTMRSIIAEVSVAQDKETAFYGSLMQLSDDGVDVSGLLDQFGTLCVQLLDGTKSADELYAALLQLENLDALQLDFEKAGALSDAAGAIDPASSSYDPLSVLESYAILESEYVELAALQRGSAEYIQRAKELTDETTAAVYRQAAAYGVVTDLQAKSAQYAANGQRDRKFRNADANVHTGSVDFLSETVRQAEESGADITQAWNNALSELDEAGILSDMTAMFGDISMLAVECGGNVEAIIARLHEMQAAAQEITLSDMAEQLRRDREGNFAETDSYQDQVGNLMTAFGDGGTEGVANAMTVWNSFDEALQSSIAETYPSLVIALDDANKAASELGDSLDNLEDAEGDMSDVSRAAGKRIAALGEELEDAQASSTACYFKNTARAIEDLKHGATSVTDAFADYNAEAEKAAEANEQYQAASKKMSAGTKVAVDEIDTLAEYLGNIDPAILLANWDQVGPMLSSALAEGEAAFHRLNEAAFITITGTSVADFSALTSGLISVQNLAADAVNALIATGQWRMETITLPQEGAQWDPLAGVWTRTMINTNQNVLRYTGSNPLRSTGGKSSSGGGGGGGGSRGGGGGGGSSSKSVSKSIQKLLDKMDEASGNSDHRRKMAQMAQEYHDVRGELQGVILYMEKEKQIVQENSKTAEGYIATLEKQIEAKRAILSKYKESSSKYKQAMVDLEALQEQHKKYSEELMQNKIDLEELDQAIQEQHDTIRQMEIDLRDTIHDAIMDREDQNRRMLEGRIDLENELIDVLTRQHEKERDALLETAELKRETLNEELNLLDEQLEARKKLNEEQDRAKELAEKEAQLARIAADPTRQKEALALRQEIAELREEMAWELAEDEVDAQKESIEEQIKSIDDYIKYVEKYYEELLANPRKLIEELQELMTKSDAEILDWLQQNHEDYENATDATREEMRLNWQEMLDDMRGKTQTYWDEVEAIISQGGDAIIEFLKENCADYKEAGKLQSEAYVDEWRKQLEDLRKALKQVSDESKDYQYTSTSSSKSSGSSSSSGSSKSSSSGKKTTTTTKQFVASGTGYAEASKSKATSVTYDGVTYVKDPNSSYWYNRSDAKLIDGGRTQYWKTGTTRYVKKYAEGGMAYNTGLAWLDGTRSKPERILSPYQTELFEDLLKTLHTIRTFQAPSSVVHPQIPDHRQQNMTIENIVVQVQRLESEQDYEEMAERVGEHIMDKVSRGMTVGGIRLG